MSAGVSSPEDRADARRLECIDLERKALEYGDHEDSLRHKLAQVLCAGRLVRQHEGSDLTAERALLQYAAAVTKAIGIAVAFQSDRDTHAASDVTLSAEEAAWGLFGLSELLSAAPTLIDSFEHGLELRSNGESGPPDDDAGDEPASEAAE